MICIINSGYGNFSSIYNIITKMNINADLTNSYDVISKSNYIILPGVGSFDKCITSLRELRIDKAIYNSLENGSKLLGICVGMQILAQGSEEGKLTGFNFISDKFIKFQNSITPHVGWNNIEYVETNDLFDGVENESYFYFLHSYFLKNNNQKYILSTTDYHEQFVSAFKCKNIHGIQFHPEKSHLNGEKILLNFFKL